MHLHASSTRCALTLTLASTLLLLAARQDSPAASDQPAASASPPIVLKLKSIEEHRILETAPPAEDDWAARMRLDKQGLFLTFLADLPAGHHILSLNQPASITAADSTGKSLLQDVDEFADEPQYIELAPSFSSEDDQPAELTLRLNLPARAATSISCSAQCQAMIYTGTEDRDFPLSSKVIAINDLLPGKKVQARFTNVDNSPAIEMRPAEVKDLIRELVVLQGETIIENSGYYSDGKTVTFPLTDDPQGDMTLRLTVITGLTSAPISIVVKNQPLP